MLSNKLSILTLVTLISLSFTAPVEEIQLRSITLCKKLLGTQACAEVSSTNGQISAKFSIGGTTVFSQALDSTNGQKCGTAAFGVTSCLIWNVSSSEVCLSATGKYFQFEEEKIDLGCVDIQSLQGN